MADLEDRIQAIIDGKREPKTTGLRVPSAFREKILAAAKEKFGGLDQERIFSATLLYFAARGLLLWEDEATQQPRKRKVRGSAPPLKESAKGLKAIGDPE